MEEAGGPVKVDRQVVLLSDHIASHDYDEAKERELFEEWADEKGFCLDCKFFESGNNFEDQATKWLYEAWQACAKSRARSAE